MAGEPTTEAGRQFLWDLDHFEHDNTYGSERAAVLAIEAAAHREGRDAALVAMRKAVEGLTSWPGVVPNWPQSVIPPEHVVAVSREAVLEALARLATEGQSGMPFTEEERRQAIETGGQSYQPEDDAG